MRSGFTQFIVKISQGIGPRGQLIEYIVKDGLFPFQNPGHAVLTARGSNARFRNNADRGYMVRSTNHRHVLTGLFTTPLYSQWSV